MIRLRRELTASGVHIGKAVNIELLNGGSWISYYTQTGTEASPIWPNSHADRQLFIMNTQKLIIYYAVYDAIGRQREIIKKSLSTQQDITAFSSVV